MAGFAVTTPMLRTSRDCYSVLELGPLTSRMGLRGRGFVFVAGARRARLTRQIPPSRGVSYDGECSRAREGVTNPSVCAPYQGSGQGHGSRSRHRLRSRQTERRLQRHVRSPVAHMPGPGHQRRWVGRGAGDGEEVDLQVRAPVPHAAARDTMCGRSPNTTCTRCVAPSSTRGMAAGSTASPSSSAAAIPRQR